MFVIFKGLAVGAGLIIAIGPQNSFIIRQGIKGERVFLSAGICALIDIALIIAGIFGLGGLVNIYPSFVIFARWFGAIFLTVYGLKAFYSVFYPKALDSNILGNSVGNIKQIIIITLGFSLLNPHAYLDTVVLIGSIATQYHGDSRYLFGIGASLASLIWFFTIAYGARRLVPIFKNEKSWQVLDFIIGCIMLIIAASLVWPIISNNNYCF